MSKFIFRKNSSTPHIGAIDRADLDHFALFDEERDIDDLAGFESGRFLDIVCRVSANAIGGFNDLENHRGWQLDLSRAALDAEDFDLEIFDQVLFGIADQGFIERDRLVGGRIHEMVALMIAVAELEGLAVHLDDIDLFSGRKTDVCRLAGSNVSNDALNKCAEVARSAVMDVENDGRVSVVTDGHSFAEIIGGWHKMNFY